MLPFAFRKKQPKQNTSVCENQQKTVVKPESDDEKTVFSKKPIMLQNIPLQLEAGSCIQKTLYFSVSELSVKKLYEKTAPHYSINAQIFVSDVLGKKYKGDLLNISISCAYDLIKKWG